MPKCASRTVLSTFKILAREKFFYLVADPQKMTVYYLKENQEQDFIQNFSSKNEPLIYSRHILYVNFTRYLFIRLLYSVVELKPPVLGGRNTPSTRTI